MEAWLLYSPVPGLVSWDWHTTALLCLFYIATITTFSNIVPNFYIFWCQEQPNRQIGIFASVIELWISWEVVKQLKCYKWNINLVLWQLVWRYWEQVQSDASQFEENQRRFEDSTWNWRRNPKKLSTSANVRHFYCFILKAKNHHHTKICLDLL